MLEAWLRLREAAPLMGLSVEAAVKRAQRGTIRARKADEAWLIAWPAETLAIGMLLVRESIARGAGDTSHRATFSVEEVATLVKVTPSLIHLEIQRGALLASKIGHIYRITPQDLQTWLEQKRPDRRLRENKESH